MTQAAEFREALTQHSDQQQVKGQINNVYDIKEAVRSWLMDRHANVHERVVRCQ